MTTGEEGRRKSSSMVLRIVESESRDRTRVCWVWLKARSLVKLSAQVALYVYRFLDCWVCVGRLTIGSRATLDIDGSQFYSVYVPSFQ